MASSKYDLAMGIGGEAGQGIATPGDILARIFVRRNSRISTLHSAYETTGKRAAWRPNQVCGGSIEADVGRRMRDLDALPLVEVAVEAPSAALLLAPGRPNSRRPVCPGRNSGPWSRLTTCAPGIGLRRL